MASYNKVLLMGNLTRDIELKAIGGGTSVGKFGLAVNRHFTTQSGEKREETTFVDCEAWGKTAETMAKYLAKGRPVFVEGRLKLDQWQDKESGQNRSKMSVVVDSFQFIDSRPGGGGGGPGGGSAGGTVEAAPSASWSKPGAKSPAGAPEPMPADDIPF